MRVNQAATKVVSALNSKGQHSRVWIDVESGTCREKKEKVGKDEWRLPVGSRPNNCSRLSAGRRLSSPGKEGTGRARAVVIISFRACTGEVSQGPYASMHGPFE